MITTVSKINGYPGISELRGLLTSDARSDAATAETELLALVAEVANGSTFYDMAHTCWFMYDGENEAWIFQFAMAPAQP